MSNMSVPRRMIALSRRVTTLASVSALALSTVAPAWSAPPPIVPRADPPARVGRLSRIAGAVSFHTEDATQWSPAAVNYPFTNGDAFWTEPSARVDLQVASNRLTLAPTTELDVATLDDHTFATSEPQGETYLELRAVGSGDSYAVQTPRGLVQITGAGRYDVVAGDTDHPTLVTVVEGAAQVTGNNLSLQVGPRQTATISGTDTFQGNVGPIAQDAFLTAMLAEDRPAPRASVPIPPIVQGMTGCESLDTTGSWAETPQYGTVWYPPVEAGWVPYRHGHWSYVAPWGWTWVDDAAWGFAPFHYGRWAQIDNRWGWIPVSPGGYADPVAAYPVPVYAPALVSFVDIGGAAVAGAAIGYAAGALSGRSVGWVPLGPREAYYPPYRTNLNYVRGINATTIQNVNQSINTTTITNNRTVVQNFFNRGAATVVPAAAMVQSQPVAAAARPLPPDQFAHAQAQFRSPIAPAATTAGVTPAVARQFNFVAPTRPAQPVPGPAIHPAVLRAGPGHGFAGPALRAATAAEPAPAAASANAPHPGQTPTPAVAAPEARPAETPGRPPAQAEAPHPEAAARTPAPAPAAVRPAEAPHPEAAARAPAPAPAAVRPAEAPHPEAAARTPAPAPAPAAVRPAEAPHPDAAARAPAPAPAAVRPAAPIQAARPQPAARPAPTARPAPVARPAAPPAAVARPAAPAPRPAPPPHPAPPPRPAAAPPPRAAAPHPAPGQREPGHG
jgi:hypothetical protein